MQGYLAAKRARRCCKSGANTTERAHLFNRRKYA